MDLNILLCLLPLFLSLYFTSIFYNYMKTWSGKLKPFTQISSNTVWLKNESIELDWTHRACAHNTLIALLGWKEVVFGEGLPRLINASIIPAGFHWSSQPCRNPRLVWGRAHQAGRDALKSQQGWFLTKAWKLELTVCEEARLPVHLGQHCWGSATGFSHGRTGHFIVLHFTLPV